MAGEVIPLTLRADISELRKEIGKIPGITAAEAKKMSNSLERNFKKATAASKRAAKASAKAQTKAARDVAKAWDKQVGDIKRGGAAAFGDIVNKITDVTDGLVALGPAGATAAVAIGGIGAAAFGAAAAAAVATTAIIAIVATADELIARVEHLETVGLGIDDGDVASIDRANDSFTALADVAALFSIELAANMAPMVERVATLMVAAGLAGLDAFKDLNDGATLVGSTFRAMVNGVLIPFENTLRGMAQTVIIFKDLMGLEVTDSLRKAAAEGDAVALVFGVVDESLTELESSSGDYLKKAKDMITQEGVHRIELQGKKEDLDKAAKATENLSKVTEEAISTEMDAAVAAEIERIRLAQQETDELETMNNAQKAWRDKDREERLAGIAKLKDAAIDAAAAVTSAIIDGINNRSKAADEAMTARLDAAQEELDAKDSFSEADKKRQQRIDDVRKAMARKRFRAEKAASMSQIVISTAAAMLKAAALTPLPAGAPFVAAAAGLGAVQLGIAAAQKPPSFHIGRAPDETPATLLKTEAVLDSRATAALGGPDAVRELTQTGSMQQGGGMSADDAGRALAKFVARELRGEGELGRLSRRPSPSARSVFR